MRLVWQVCWLSLVPGEECRLAMVVKFTPVGVCSLVGMSAEFGTLGGMLIGYSR